MLHWPRGDGDMARLIRQLDWEATPLGVIDRWPQSLKSIVEMMLHSPSMMSLVWGAEAIHIYNDPFMDLLQEHRATSLGRSAFETFARSPSAFEDDLAEGMAGQSRRLLAQRYPVLRNGGLEDGWFDVDYSPVLNDAGDVGGVLWILREVTTQVLSERALRKSETRHRLLIESWAQAEWETDADGVVVDDSPSWRAYTGQSLDEWLGYGWLDAIHPDDRAYAERQWREATTARSLVNAEFRLRSADGGWRWTNVRAAPVIDDTGKIEKWAGINIDIDGRKRAEDALRASERKYHDIFERMDEGFALCELVRDASGRGVDYRYVEINPALVAHSGISPDTLQGRSASEVFPNLDPWLIETYSGVVDRQQSTSVDHYFPHVDQWLRINAFPRGGDQFAVLFADITERKRTEASSRENQERQSFLLKLSDALRAEPDADAVAYRALRLLSDHLGLDRCYITYYRPDDDEADFPYQVGNETVPPLPPKVKLSDFPEAYAEVQERTFVINDDFERRGLSEAERANSKALGMRAMLASTLREGANFPLASLAAVSSRPRHWNATEIALVEETAERTWAAIERARADAALRASEEKYRSLFESMDEAYAVVEVLKDDTGKWADFRFIDANPAFIEHTSMPYPVGKTATELLGSPNPRWTKLYGEALDTGQPLRVEEDEHTLGRTFDLNIFSLDRENNRVAVLFTNVTERKLAEVALRESEERYRSLFETMDQGYSLNELVRDAEGRAIDIRYIEHNPALERLTGIPASQAIGRLASEVFPGLDRFWIDVVDRVVTSGNSEQVEHELSPIGRWYESKLYPVGGDRCASLFEDITDRKRAEALLRESEERQAFLLRFTDAIRSETSEQAVIERALTILAEELALDRCYVTRLHPSEDLTEVVHEVRAPGLEPMPASFRNSDFPEAYKQTFDRTLVFEDTADDPGLTEADKQALASMRFGALLSRPLRRSDSPMFAVGAVSCLPRRWTPYEISLVEEVTERIWEAAERARAETALRHNEERLSLAIEIGALASWDWDVTSGAVAWNDRHFLIQGYGVGEVTPSFETWIARVHPDDRDETVALIDAARTGRLVFAHDFRSLHPDGRVVWCSARGRFFYGPDGQPVRMIGVMEDITGRVQAEAALRESEARFRQFGEASHSALWVRDAKTFAFEYVSPSVQHIYGVAPEKLLLDERLLGATVLPEERDAVSEKVRRVSGGETIVQEYRILRGSDHAFRWIRSTGFPIYDGEGSVRRIAAIAEDVTEAKIAVEHQTVLLAELQHRVRNIMAMIRSTAVRSAEGAADVQDYKTSLAGRLLALARVQTLLTRQANAGGSLRDILESEIGAQAHSEHQYELTGPDIMLSPKAVEVLTLAFHELSTNALKYGALSVSDGKISVNWEALDKREKPWLVIDWVEEGAPQRPPPTRRGFGSELIEAKIPYELRGTGKTTIAPGGARCHIEFPLREAESILETDAPTPTRIYGGSVDMTGAPDLTGKIVLVVEDDYYVASDTAAALRSAGAEVLGPCPTEEDALQLLEEETPTAVVLDLNLGGGGPKFQIAHKLVGLGTPFIFLTGYDPDVIPDNLAHVVRLQKPIALREVVEAVSRLSS